MLRRPSNLPPTTSVFPVYLTRSLFWSVFLWKIDHIFCSATSYALFTFVLLNISFGGYAQNSFPLLSSGTYSGGYGDYSTITNPQLKLDAPTGWVRVVHTSQSGDVASVYNFQSGKDAYWGESSDAGKYFFRGRHLVVNDGNFSVGNPNPLAKVVIRTSPAIQGLVLTNCDATGSQSHLAFTTADQSRVGMAPESYFNLYNNGRWTWNSAKTSTGVTIPIAFSIDNTPRLLINTDGNVSIGTTTPGTHKLAVEGKIGAREVNVTLAAWSDYVFADDYNLPSLSELELFIKEHQHLPEIPTEKEVLENGVNLGEMNALLLKKIEELTLHMIALEKRLAQQEKLNKELREKHLR